MQSLLLGESASPETVARIESELAQAPGVRAVLELVSIATAGAPFLTAMTDPLRRGVHDRASGTRVVALPSH